MAGLRAVDEAILQRDAKAAPQEALSFRPPDNSPFRRHFTRGFLLCLYAYSTRFAWECQCPFCTNPPGASLCRLRDARSGGGPVRRKTRAGGGKTGAAGAISRPGGDGGNGKPVCAQTKGRANRISFVRRRTDRAFPRAVEPPAFFLCRREETASLPRTGEPTTLFTRTVGPTAFLSCAGGQPYRKNAARQDAPAARRFFRRVRPPSPFCRTAFGSAGAAGAAHGSSKFSKNQPLPFYVISKRA